MPRAKRNRRKDDLPFASLQRPMCPPLFRSTSCCCGIMTSSKNMAFTDSRLKKNLSPSQEIVKWLRETQLRRASSGTSFSKASVWCDLPIVSGSPFCNTKLIEKEKSLSKPNALTQSKLTSTVCTGVGEIATCAPVSFSLVSALVWTSEVCPGGPYAAGMPLALWSCAQAHSTTSGQLVFLTTACGKTSDVLVQK